MTTLPVSALPDVRAKLRPLSGVEHLFWALDKINGFNFGMAVSFRGTIAHSRWRDAFARAQKRHPFLDAAINEDDPHAPWFARGTGLPIPLAFLRRNSSTDWQRVMESEIAEPFDLSTGPLLRAAILEDEKGSDLVLTTHHAVIDGIGVLAVVRELLRALAGEALAELPIPPPAEERATAIRALNPLPAALDAATYAAEPQPRNRIYASRNRKGKCAIASIRLSQQQSARLLRYARREQTTIGAVLMAAAASALRELSPQLKQADLRLTTALDVRPYIANEEDFVLSVISPRAIVPHPEEELAASARAIKAQIAPAQSFLAIEAIFTRVGAILTQKLDAAALVNMLVEAVGHDVLVSNLKTVEIPVQPDGLVVESVWGPSVLCGFGGEHAIGAATFDSALHLVYTSFAAVAGLLDTIHEKLMAACADA
jgi:Condensation domain